ncbi:f-box only protein [Anaeramoeba flamelloides]|uniref:F-box only protein n=1 Tax=Anaeramoeba flamelloides TaxID=1746091 RepID=A0AAV8AAG6_9EUKA|nr:f-box only protein [Anaeramoeba flamelloides]
MNNVISSIIREKRKFRAILRSIKYNNTKCSRLSERVGEIITFIQKSQLHERPQEIKSKSNILKELQKSIQAARILIEKHQQKSLWFPRLLKKGTSKNDFNDVYTRLYNCSVGLSMKTGCKWGESEEDKEDENTDLYELKSFLVDLKENPELINKIIIEQKKQLEKQNKKFDPDKASNLVTQLLQRLKIQIHVSQVEEMKEQKTNSKEIHQSDEFLEIQFKELTLKKRLAFGAFGEVFVADWLGTQVAVKKLITEKITEEIMAEYLNEVQTMSALRHPNVVQLIGATKNYPYCLVMKYYKYGSLYDIIHNKEVDLRLLEMLRPKLPQDLDPDLKLLIEECWDETPDNRPDFNGVASRLIEICEKLEKIYFKEKGEKFQTKNLSNFFLKKDNSLEKSGLNKDLNSLEKQFERFNPPLTRLQSHRVLYVGEDDLKQKQNQNENENGKENGNENENENENENGNGNENENNFSTITDALKEANTGHVIELSAGIHYFDGADITIPGLRIRGKNGVVADSIIVECTSERSAFCFKAMNCGIFGVTVKNKSQKKSGYGIIEVLEGNTIISGCFIIGNEQDLGISCILVRGSKSSPIIKNNILTGCTFGLSIYEQCKCFAEENDIIKNKNCGIFFSNSKSCLIKQNLISENLSCGLFVTSSEKINIYENKITKNNNCGVKVIASKISIKSNNIAESAENGIMLMNETNGNVIGNLIWKNLDKGIIIASRSNVNIVNNSIASNRIGIEINVNVRGLIKLNKIFANLEKSIFDHNQKNENKNHNNNNNNNNNNRNSNNNPKLKRMEIVENEIQELKLNGNSHENAPLQGISKRKDGKRQIIVDPKGTKTIFTTISAAIKKSMSGDVIKIKPGIYRERIIIKKTNLELYGAYKSKEQKHVIIESNGHCVFSFRTKSGRVSNLIFKQLGKKHHAVDIMSGELLMQNCEIIGKGTSCLSIRKGANPTIRDCQIYNGKIGCALFRSARGTIQNCKIFENEYQGICLTSSSATNILDCKIFKNEGGGIYVGERSSGVIKNCEISFNKNCGITVKSNATPIIKNNKIHHNQQDGCNIIESGYGEFVENEIYKNGKSGIACKNNGNPKVIKNKIYSNSGMGIFVYSNSTGTFQKNDIYGNSLSGIQTKIKGDPRIEENKIHHNLGSGFCAYQSSRGKVFKNEIFQNGLRGVYIESQSNPLIYSNNIHDNKKGGIFVYKNGGGFIKKNTIQKNRSNQVLIKRGCYPLLSKNIIPNKGLKNENCK